MSSPDSSAGSTSAAPEGQGADGDPDLGRSPGKGVPPGPRPTDDDRDRLRVALLTYRGNPRCGGQGVYVRHLAGELASVGHRVTVLSGPPYPELAPGVALVRLPSLDLYREPDPFRIPRPSEIRGPVDLLEVGMMLTGGFPEPLAFAFRAVAWLRRHRSDLDVVHDNQGLGWPMLRLGREGWPLVATVHHPTTVDRDLALADAGSLRRRLGVRRWYGFVRMQQAVARRMPVVLTASQVAAEELVATYRLDPARLRVVPVGVDPEVFRPRPDVARVAGRIVAVASADVPLKGVVHLLDAVAQLESRRSVELVVVGRLTPDGAVARRVRALGAERFVRFVSGLSDAELADLWASAEVAVVPSLYEGFSLPAVEAMACGTPLVATSGGALAEVAGPDGEVALVVPPGDAAALADRIARLLDAPELAARLGQAGRQRVLARYTWRRCAEGTVAAYREVLGGRPGASGPCNPTGRTLATDGVTPAGVTPVGVTPAGVGRRAGAVGDGLVCPEGRC